MESAHWAVLAALVSQIPTTIVCVGGIVWVLLRLEQQRRAALFLLAGLSLYLLLGISQLFLQGPLQLLLSSLVLHGDPMVRMRLNSAVIGFGFGMLRAVSLGLMAYAAFVDRPIVAVLAPGEPMR